MYIIRVSRFNYAVKKVVYIFYYVKYFIGLKNRN